MKTGFRVAILCLVGGLACFASYAETLRIYHIDVEQADATLFVSPSGKTLLVDSGKNGHGDRIKVVMDAAGVTRIDHFVATHYHEDHYGGIDDLVDLGVTVSKSYDRGDRGVDSAKKRQVTYKGYRKAVGSSADAIAAGGTIAFDSAMSVTCISADGVVINENLPKFSKDENDRSVSLYIQYGDFRYFVGGDIEKATESKIAERDLVMDVDVYQADHHGSDTSSSVDFMEDLGPTVIVISNGNIKKFGHPRKVTLKTYRELDPAPTVFQTNKFLRTNTLAANVADEFIADPETSDEDGTILITVDLDDDQYIVSYGTTRKEFDIKHRSDGSVIIESLLPNPVGADRELESVTLLNRGTDAVAIGAWRLQDAAGKSWSLVSLGAIDAGASKTIARGGMAMSLNNGGDTVTLLTTQNGVADRFTYSASVEGQAIQTGH